ncbi:UTRA domain-containing protein [Streptomonospora litoralis]|uniref:UTRA domain protein n=1 Tax=Streptomonospora litoralis TaxID=2498135 RepID=A0A4P6Q1L8_9ACTN|nr:UTRA domain-containing protein [Streptomonospora litoralis]QBI52487.1 UTRA domain protein [Streptomonospora litoralis]
MVVQHDTRTFYYPASRERVRAGAAHDAFDQFAVDEDMSPAKQLEVTSEPWHTPRPVVERLGTDRTLLRRAVRAVDGRVVALEDSYYPADLAAGTDLERAADIPEGTINTLAALGHRQIGYEDEVAAHRATAEEGAYLGVPEGTPAVRAVRKVWSAERVLRVTVTVAPLGGGMVLRYESGEPAPVSAQGR